MLIDQMHVSSGAVFRSDGRNYTYLLPIGWESARQLTVLLWYVHCIVSEVNQAQMPPTQLDVGLISVKRHVRKTSESSRESPWRQLNLIPRWRQSPPPRRRD